MKQLFLNLSKIRDDAGVQSRVIPADPATVEEYAELMLSGVEFPAVITFFDGGDYWLADGFQRLAAKKRAGATAILAEVHPGGFAEARLHSAGANASHGLKRTPADKRKAVHLVLQDEHACTWDDQAIADHCHVGIKLVKALRLSTSWQQPDGLFGPDDTAEPPPPDLAKEEASRTTERARRAARKYLRFCETLGLDPAEFLAVIHQEMAQRPERKVREKKDNEENT